MPLSCIRVHVRRAHSLQFNGFQQIKSLLSATANHLFRTTSKAVMSKSAIALITRSTITITTTSTVSSSAASLQTPNKLLWTCESRIRLENRYCTFQPMNLLPIKFSSSLSLTLNGNNTIIIIYVPKASPTNIRIFVINNHEKSNTKCSSFSRNVCIEWIVSMDSLHSIHFHYYTPIREFQWNQLNVCAVWCSSIECVHCTPSPPLRLAGRVEVIYIFGLFEDRFERLPFIQ